MIIANRRLSLTPRGPGGGALWILVLVVVLSALAAGLAIGSVAFSPQEWLSALTDAQDSLARTVILELRLPRVLTAFVVGGLLALSGALLQVLLRNPLADPYVLGVSGGAAVGALLGLLLGAGTSGSAVGAGIGALVSVALVVGLARRGMALAISRLLLTGVVLAAGFGAIIGLLLALAPDAGLRGMLFWLMGDLGAAQGLEFGAALLSVALVLVWVLARPINLLARGTRMASVFGLSAAPLEIQLYVLASLLTATAVSMAGTIGFVGLLAPHLTRLLTGDDHRRLLPACTLLGGSLLVCADALARGLFAPRELPVGTMTALIGTPVFLWLLRRAEGRSG